MREPGNQPVEVTGFTGRIAELRLGLGLFSGARLVTVTGPGGVGKTRLALRLAGALRRRFPDGIWHTELSAPGPLRSRPGDVVTRVAEALGRRFSDGRGGAQGPGEIRAGMPAAELGRAVAGWRALVVLDTCDGLLGEVAALAGELLRAAPRIRVLATSRRPLGVEGERLLPVAPLPLGDSVRLFEERAVATDPDFALTPLTVPVVTEICRRLDGLPLAIELAAASLGSLSVEELLGRLDDRFGLLEGVTRAPLKRHQGLRAALEWSYELCDPRQRMLWARLSVFPGEFGAEDAEAVCADDALPPEAVGPALAGLVEGSIVTRAGARHRLLGSLRELGSLRLREHGGAETLAARHGAVLTARAAQDVQDEAMIRPSPAPSLPSRPAERDERGLLTRDTSASPSALPVSETLSERQLEVAELITEGLSNSKIAERLMIAKRTVDAHIRNILAKGGLTSRTQVATWMVADRDLPDNSGFIR
jgi:predicted ATPase/DNA-binding CsgD family transcriptional regulator